MESKITIKQYLDSITNSPKKSHVQLVLNQFDIFCNQKYNKSSQQVLYDIHDEVSKTRSNDKVYVLFNHFKEWLLVDHLEIEYFLGANLTQRRTIQARHPNTVKLYLIKIRSVFEEIGNIEINSRLFNKRVKIPMAEEKNPESFTKEQMRLLLGRCSNHNKLKYMVLKDTGCRIDCTVVFVMCNPFYSCRVFLIVLYGILLEHCSTTFQITTPSKIPVGGRLQSFEKLLLQDLQL